jgi:predicted transposase YdaD
MFQDILRESWVYQEIGQKFLEEGREEGLEQGLEQGLERGREEERRWRLQGQHEMLASFVQAHFPEITDFAKQQTDDIKDPEVLQNAILRLLAAKTVEEAKQLLACFNKDKQKH